jgi:hypothetical protein
LAKFTNPQSRNLDMKKGCLIAASIGLFFLLVLAAIIFFVFRLTAPMTAEGEKFLKALGSGSPEVAYAMTSATMQNGQTQADFTSAVKAYGLDGFQSASWSNRNISNDRGTLEGTAQCKNGGSVPLTIEMIKESGTWKVLSIKGPQTGASTGPIIEKEAVPMAAPATAEAAKLALASLLSFNDAIQTKSFDKFHAGISQLWQEQTTPGKLREIFQTFIDKGIDIVAIKTLSPAFKTAPAVNSDGVLILEGEYPVEPGKVQFKLKYVTEGKAWKLVGVNVHVGE